MVLSLKVELLYLYIFVITILCCFFVARNKSGKCHGKRRDDGKHKNRHIHLCTFPSINLTRETGSWGLESGSLVPRSLPDIFQFNYFLSSISPGDLLSFIPSLDDPLWLRGCLVAIEIKSAFILINHRMTIRDERRPQEKESSACFTTHIVVNRGIWIWGITLICMYERQIKKRERGNLIVPIDYIQNRQRNTDEQHVFFN